MDEFKNDNINSENENNSQDDTIIIESTEQVQNIPIQPVVEHTQQFPTYQQTYAEEPHIERQSTLNGVSYFPNTPPPPEKKKGKRNNFV